MVKMIVRISRGSCRNKHVDILRGKVVVGNGDLIGPRAAVENVTIVGILGLAKSH